MNKIHQRFFIGCLLIPLVLNACSPSLQEQPKLVAAIPPAISTIVESPKPPTTPNHTPTQGEITITEDQTVLGLTFQKPSGNRFIAGKGDLPMERLINIDLPGKPIWITGAPYGSGSAWTVALDNGDLVSFFVEGAAIEELDTSPESLPQGMPISVRSAGEEYSIVRVSDPEQSTTSHPIYLPKSERRVHITQTGEIKITDPEDQTIATLRVNALLDARILFDENERLLVLSDPTDKYPHGVLGDSLEAASITLVDTHPLPRVARVISLADNEVIEGIAPIWVDANQDGQREIIVTISDLNLGSGIVVFSESGDRLAEGEKIGRAFRWRHQIAIEKLSPEGDIEMVVVRTPHIGGVAEYYQFSDGILDLVAEFPGITSHSIGSRNLDLAAVGDFDGDGVIELLTPEPGLSELIAVRRTPSGAEEVWRLPLGGRMSTNLSVVTLPNGEIVLGIGREDGVLNLWLPE